MTKMKRILSISLLIIILAGTLVGCNSKKDKSFQTMEDFQEAKIGIMLGSSFDVLAKEYLPEAERYYFGGLTDLLLNLRQKKVDGVMLDKAFFTSAYWENGDISYVEMDMPKTQYAAAFPPDSTELKSQIDEFIRVQTENGWLGELEKKWFGKSEPTAEPIDLSQLSGEKGVLRVATNVESKPFAYLKEWGVCGYDIDFIFKFAKEYGYSLDIQTVDFSAILPGLRTDKYDIALSGITVTEERKESVLFSDIYCESPVLMAILVNGETPNAEQGETDFSTAKIGVLTGSFFDLLAGKHFPEAEKLYYMNISDLILNLKQEKIDGILMDKGFFTPLGWEDKGLSYIEMDMPATEYAVAFPKASSSEALVAQMNDFIRSGKENGAIAELEKKWFASSEPDMTIDFSQLTGENGTLRVATTVESKPFCYLKGGELYGFDMALLFEFAKQYGYALEIDKMDFGALLPSLSGDRYDFAIASITVTEERRESVLFSDVYCTSPIVMAVVGNGSNNNKKVLSDFEDSTIGILTGTGYDDYAKERFPNAERKDFNLVTDMVFAVESGKIDGFLSENTYVSAALWEGAKIDTVDEAIDHTQAGFIFRKNSAESAAVREQLNEFIISSKSNGLLDELNAKWISSKEPTEFFDNESLTGENGTLKVAVSPDLKPLSYMRNGVITGYEIEILQHFAKEYGYDLEFYYMAFDAILPGVVSGKYDIGTGGTTITEERAESVDFSESYLTVNVVMAVSSVERAPEEPSFFENIKESFEKTFIREERWKLIVEGIGVTMLISVCAVIAGSLFGFGLYMLSRSDVKLVKVLARGFAKGYSRIIAGTPIVVILMILFYVIFGKVRDMSGIVVAVIGFTLTFGAFVYDHMTVSVGSVDNGQTEAAYALGYTKNKTFFRIIFPQAMSIFLPSYCGQAVELIKATAVVGYIAVNDLTKMGDIIRSNTYEAFFPLIATAVIYFLLTWALSLLLKLIKLRFEPKRRKKETILKGVKTK